MRDYIGKKKTVTPTTLNYLRPRYHLLPLLPLTSPYTNYDTTSKGSP